MSANAVDLFAGVNVPPPTAAGQVLQASAAGAASWTGPPLDLAGAGAAPMFGAAVTGDANNRAELRANGNLALGPGSGVPDLLLSRNATGPSFGFNHSLDVQAAGSGLKIAEGANAKQGTFALSGAATTVVANTAVTANSRIFLQTLTLGTVVTASTLAVSAITPGTSFTVTPSQATDTSTVAFEIFEPG